MTTSSGSSRTEHSERKNDGRTSGRSDPARRRPGQLRCDTWISTSASSAAATSPGRSTVSSARRSSPACCDQAIGCRRAASWRRELAVSRTTVTVAYDRLAGEGFLSSRVGAGTFVSDDVPIAGARAGRSPAGVLRPLPIWERVVDAAATRQRRPRYDFRLGRPDPTLFPFEQWRSLVTRQLTRHAAAGSGYGEPAGHEGLREAIARHIGTSRAVRATAADVVITNGIQQAVDLIARTLLSPGDSRGRRGPGLSAAQRSAHRRSARSSSASPSTMRESSSMRSHRPFASSSSRRRISSRSGSRCPCAAAWPCCAGPRNTTQRSSRTTTTVSSASAAARSSRCRASTRPGGCVYTGSFSKTMLPSMRLGFLVTPAVVAPGAARGQVRDRLGDVDS